MKPLDIEDYLREAGLGGQPDPRGGFAAPEEALAPTEPTAPALPPAPDPQALPDKPSTPLGDFPAGPTPAAGPTPDAGPAAGPTPAQASALSAWTAASKAPEPSAEPRPTPAQGEKQALEQVDPAAVPPAPRKDAAEPPAASPPTTATAPAETSPTETASAGTSEQQESPSADIAQKTPSAAAEPGHPNVHPYGMEAPPEVSRDRLGEIARTVLGVFAGKDKWAKRAALAGGVTTMISAKPGEEVDKENYDRRLKASGLAAQEGALGLRAEQQKATAEYQRGMIERWRQQNALAGRNTDVREKGLELRTNKQDVETNPDHPAVQALKQHLYQRGAQPGSLDHQNLMTLRQDPAYRQEVALYMQEKGIPVDAAQAGAQSSARTQAQINVETDPSNLSRTVDASSQKTAANAQASAEGGQQGKLNSGVTMNAESLMKNTPYVHATDMNQLQSALSDPARSGKLTNQLQGYGRSRDVVVKMDHLRQVFRESSNPLSSKFDPLTAYNARETYESHADEYAAAMGQLANVSSQGTNEHFRSRVPSIANFAISMDKLYEQIDANAHSNLGWAGIEPTRPNLTGPYIKPDATPVSQIKPQGHAAPRAPKVKKNTAPITLDDL